MGGLAVVIGGLEVGLVAALWKGDGRNIRGNEVERGSENHDVGHEGMGKVNYRYWPTTLMAVLAAALLAAGVLRHYWDIYTHRTVRGISFLFVGIDAAGDLFSLISIFFQQQFDVLGVAIYGTELVLWIGVFACGGWFNLLPFLRSILSSWRQSRIDRANGTENPDADVHGQIGQHLGNLYRITMHRETSSTSVFRTPSTTLIERTNRDARTSIELG